VRRSTCARASTVAVVRRRRPEIYGVGDGGELAGVPDGCHSYEAGLTAVAAGDLAAATGAFRTTRFELRDPCRRVHRGLMIERCRHPSAIQRNEDWDGNEVARRSRRGAGTRVSTFIHFRARGQHRPRIVTRVGRNCAGGHCPVRAFGIPCCNGLRTAWCYQAHARQVRPRAAIGETLGARQCRTLRDGRRNS